MPAIIARYYGCPAYLVGSARYETNPRDIDIVIKIPDELFLHMYGDAGIYGETIETWADAVDKWQFNSRIWKMWAKDIAKQGRELTMIAMRQVDFKTQPDSYFETIKKERICLVQDW